jgi:hypothetical protein
MEPNFYRLCLLPTYEMATRDAYQAMYYASCTKAIGGMMTEQVSCTNQAGSRKPTLALPSSLPLLMPKAPSDSSTLGAIHGGAACSPPSNPTGLCGLMMRPHARSIDSESLQKAAPTFDEVLSYSTSPLKNPQDHSAVISRPGSPFVSPVPTCPRLPTSSHFASSTSTTTRRVSSASGSSGSTCHEGSVNALARPRETQFGPSTLSQREANMQQFAVCPLDAGISLPKTVPRCVSQDALGETDTKQLQYHPIVANPLALLSAPATFLVEACNAALAQGENGLEGDATQGDDEDFAHILYELAHGHTA